MALGLSNNKLAGQIGLTSTENQSNNTSDTSDTSGTSSGITVGLIGDLKEKSQEIRENSDNVLKDSLEETAQEQHERAVENGGLPDSNYFQNEEMKNNIDNAWSTGKDVFKDFAENTMPGAQALSGIGSATKESWKNLPENTQDGIQNNLETVFEKQQDLPAFNPIINPTTGYVGEALFQAGTGEDADTGDFREKVEDGLQNYANNPTEGIEDGFEQGQEVRKSAKETAQNIDKSVKNFTKNIKETVQNPFQLGAKAWTGIILVVLAIFAVAFGQLFTFNIGDDSQ